MAKRQYAHANPKLLVWARTSLRMGPEEAAERLGVSPECLAAWEAGQAAPTIPQFRKAAAVYRRPLAAFFLPEPPEDALASHDTQAGAKHLQPELSPELVDEIRKADLRKMTRNQAIDILRRLSCELHVSDECRAQHRC